MWFKTTPSDPSFVDSSPHRIAAVAIIDAPPSRVFDIFANSEHQREWMHDFRACRWTSGEPHGVGSTREIELKAITAQERFLIWEPGQRLMFSVDAVTVPLVKQMLEDMRFEPLAEGTQTRLVWHIHYAPAPAAVPLHPIARAVFSHMFGSSAKNLAKWVKTNS